MKHPGHMYGGFISAISKWGMTHMSQQEVVAYFTKAIRHYRDKEMLVIPFNTGNPINFYQVGPGLVL
jgi:hypothetical protein